MVDKVGVGCEHPVREPGIAHELPDVLGGVELRAFGREHHERDVVWNHEAGREVPSGLDRSVPRDEEWLLVEWPTEEEKPTKFWLATVPENVAFDRLVALAKLRWRIERDYQELKQELGLGHFEGRGWRGFHHHATLCIAAYAFLVAEPAR